MFSIARFSLALGVIAIASPSFAAIQVTSKGGVGSQLNSRPVFIGDRLIKKGDRLATASKSWVAMRMAVNAAASIGGGSALFVRGFTSNSTAIAVSGRLKINIPRGRGHNFAIGGSGSVSRTSSTIFSVSAVGKRHCTAVEEGEVQLEAGKGFTQIIKADQFACSFDGQEPTEPKAIDRSTKLSVEDLGPRDGVPTCKITVTDSALLWEISGKSAKPLNPSPTGEYVVSYAEPRDYRVEALTGEITGYRVQDCKGLR